ncbi:MAG: glycosyltransferase family 4 protein [bacterium]
MKFCFVDRSIGPAIWRIVTPVALRLIAEGHQVDFVRLNDGRELAGPIPTAHVNVVDISVPLKKNFYQLMWQQILFAKGFRKYLAYHKPDVVHTHFAVPSIVARWVAAKEGVPLIVSTQHEIYSSMSFHYRWGLRFTERYCSAVTYVSNTVASSFRRKAERLENTERGRKPIHVVIPNGVDVGAIREAIHAAVERAPARIVCAGRMVPVKGQFLLLRALKVITGDYPKAQVVLIGSGPMEKELRELVRTLGLESQVEFTGWLPQAEVLREMASASLVVVPSSKVQEGFGLVLAEAIVCQTPLLVSDIPIFHEVLDAFPGRGEFFPEGDVTGLAEALKKHLESDAEKKRLLPALTGAEEDKLSSEKMVDSYLTLYRNLRVFRNN